MARARHHAAAGGAATGFSQPAPAGPQRHGPSAANTPRSTLHRRHLGRPSRRGFAPPPRRHHQRPSPPCHGAIWADLPPMLCTATGPATISDRARAATDLSGPPAGLAADGNGQVQSAATSRAAIVLDPTAARLQHIVTGPFGSGKSPSPSGRGLRCDRLFAASTREPATPRTIRHQHAAGCTTPAPSGPGRPPRL